MTVSNIYEKFSFFSACSAFACCSSISLYDNVGGLRRKETETVNDLYIGISISTHRIHSPVSQVLHWAYVTVSRVVACEMTSASGLCWRFFKSRIWEQDSLGNTLGRVCEEGTMLRGELSCFMEDMRWWIVRDDSFRVEIYQMSHVVLLHHIQAFLCTEFGPQSAYAIRI